MHTFFLGRDFACGFVGGAPARVGERAHDVGLKLDETGRKRILAGDGEIKDKKAPW